MEGKNPLRWRLCVLPLQTAGGVHRVVYTQSSSHSPEGPTKWAQRIVNHGQTDPLGHPGTGGGVEGGVERHGPSHYLLSGVGRGGRLEEDMMDNPHRIIQIQTNTTPPPADPCCLQSSHLNPEDSFMCVFSLNLLQLF